MTDAPQTFNFYGQDVRVAIIDGEVWFAAKDVCNAIGITSYSDILNALDDNEKRVTQFPDADKNRYSLLTFISEYALFRLVFKCASKEAETFATWINQHVLPELHRQCFYAHDEENEKSRSLLGNILHLHRIAKKGQFLLSLPENLSISMAANLLQNFGFHNAD